MHTVKTKSTDLEQETKGAWVPGSQRHITASKDSHDHVSGRDCQNLEAFCDLLFPFFKGNLHFFLQPQLTALTPVYYTFSLLKTD